MSDTVRFCSVKVDGRPVGHFDSQLKEARQFSKIIRDAFKRWSTNFVADGFRPNPREKNPDRKPNKVLEIEAKTFDDKPFRIVLAYTTPVSPDPFGIFLMLDQRQYKLGEAPLDADVITQDMITYTIVTMISEYPQVNLHKLK